jgi:hypothetical protein
MAGSTPIVLGTPVQTGAQRYVNRLFGFSVQIPAGRPTCRAEPYTQDTGIMIFLDRGPSDCRDRNKRASVSVNGNYNAMEAHSLFELLAIYCGTAQPQRTSSEEFGNLREVWPAMCRVQRENGFVDLILVRQSPVSTVGETPRIDYDAVIHASSGELSKHVKSAKEILRSVRFLPPTE